MKTIIPAKSKSHRVPNKNWRAFHNNKNLVEIKIEQLLQSVSPSDIFLSCDDGEKEIFAKKYKINFLLREDRLASDETPWPDAFFGIIQQLDCPDNEDILWAEVINPVFSNYTGMIEARKKTKNSNDSIVLVSEFNKFLLSEKGKPVNFVFGKWHAMSQNLDKYFSWDSACIMSKKDMLYFSYPIGKTPFLFDTEGAGVDIDTMDDFNYAQWLYEKKESKHNN